FLRPARPFSIRTCRVDVTILKPKNLPACCAENRQLNWSGSGAARSTGSNSRQISWNVENRDFDGRTDVSTSMRPTAPVVLPDGPDMMSLYQQRPALARPCTGRHAVRKTIWMDVVRFAVAPPDLSSYGTELN